MVAAILPWLFPIVVTLVGIVHGRVCNPDLVNRTNPNEYFVNPPQFCNDNNYIGVSVFPEGTSQILQWVSSASPVSLRLSQINATDPTDTIAESLSENTFQWNGCLPKSRSLDNGITFNFVLNDADGNFLCSSDFFNLTTSDTCSSAASSASSSASAASSTANSATGTTSAAPTGSNTATSSSPTSTTTDTAQDGSSLGTSAKIGIGVGVGLGVLSLCVLAVAIYLFRSRRRRNEQTAPTAWTPANPYHGQKYHDGMPQEYARYPVHELGGNKPIYDNRQELGSKPMHQTRQELPP